MAFDTRDSSRKRGVNIFYAEGILESELGDTLGTLPACFVTNAFINVTTVSTTGTSTVDVKVGSTVIGNECAATAAGYAAGTAAPAKFATGGVITVVDGAVAPAAGDLVFDLYLEYIEYDKVTGELTAI